MSERRRIDIGNRRARAGSTSGDVGDQVAGQAGGQVVRDRRIPLARPLLDEDDIAAAERALRSGWLVIGPENRDFEALLAEITGRAHAIAVTSGTTAIELGLWALAEADRERGRPLPDGAEVIVPAAGFPAAANSARRMGYRVVAIDVEPGTWNFDCDALDAAVTERTFAAVVVDTFGAVAECAPLIAMSEERGFHIIDDAACSLGAFAADGTAGGGYGDLATFSFHPRKLITTGEGGAIVCDDPQLAEYLRQLRNHGQVGRGQFARAGTNARLSEVAAAIGNSQLQRLQTALSERRLLVEGYRERLAGLCASGLLTWQSWPDGARPAHQTFAVLLAEDLPGGRDRAAVQAFLKDRDIETGVATFALSRLSMCADWPGLAGASFPVAEALHDRGLALPLYQGMRSADLDRVTDALAEALS